MPACEHVWIAIAPHEVECFNCGARQHTPYVHMQSGEIVRPEALSPTERDKRRPLPPEILADAHGGPAPPLGRVLGVTPIPTTTIHGAPILWPPITETETHD